MELGYTGDSTYARILEKLNADLNATTNIAYRAGYKVEIKKIRGGVIY